MLDTLVSTVTYIFLTLLVGAIFVLLAAPKDRREDVKNGLISFAKIVALFLVAGAVYFTPENYVLDFANWMAKNLWGFKFLALPIYSVAIYAFYRLVDKIWRG